MLKQPSARGPDQQGANQRALAGLFWPGVRYKLEPDNVRLDGGTQLVRVQWR
jgi:hypothetical protein